MEESSPVSLPGPLAGYVAGFSTELASKGYRPRKVEDHVRLLAHGHISPGDQLRAGARAASQGGQRGVHADLPPAPGRRIAPGC